MTMEQRASEEGRSCRSNFRRWEYCVAFVEKIFLITHEVQVGIEEKPLTTDA